MQYDDELEIDLGELFRELLNHWVAIFVSTIMMAAVFGSISYFLITPMYQSSAQLYVLSKSTSLTSLADLQIGTGLSKDYQVVISSRPVLEQVIENLKIEETHRELASKISVSSPSDRILQITVKDASPARAKQIVDELADVSAAYISAKMDQAPPSVISYGYEDGKKVSPRNSRNTLLGAMLGFALAAGIVILSYLMNDTIMSTDDIERKLGITVLGTLPLDETEEEADKHSMKIMKKEQKRNKKRRKAS